ncbi:uncharacterized protein LOC112568301 [Pomacea canaliculata]|uniref:uncharacterized protein LOC112568301 n=1 Tax=Pomacea canaliculata TaxID=400727 RepID=UPI000D7262DA|nr:uncharacterized protein LOC112568301 [Pomacea canaliculata]
MKMWILNLHHAAKPQVWTVWTAAVVLLFGPSIVRSVVLSPCGDDGVTEVLADQDTDFTCAAEGQVQWRLKVLGARSSELLATCEYGCTEMETYDNLFIAKIGDPLRSSHMTVRPGNRSNILLLGVSLQCVIVSETTPVPSAECNLNYACPPEGVSCTAMNTSWVVTVSCVIGSVFSSRGRYTCQLYQEKHGLLQSKNESVKQAVMVTSATREIVGSGRVKMSGSCQFNTTIPAVEGQYSFFVAISPGGRTYDVIFTAGHKWLAIERPHSPDVSCSPQSSVLENTGIVCTCSTPSLGEPAGYLMWITGNDTKHRTVAWQENSSLELHYTHNLTLSDHGKTLFWCDVIWGQENIHGQSYTANVGYPARPVTFSFSVHEKNQKVREGEQVTFLCESDGRPTPNISIYDKDNDKVIYRGRSPLNYTFIARCEDTATYTCSAWNEFSRQSGETTSVSLDLDVLCKPRGRSRTHLGEYTIHLKKEVTFDTIAYPVPYAYQVWLLAPSTNNSESIESKINNSMLTITCKAGTVRRYLSTCTVTILDIPLTSTGWYKMQVINEAGDENFTVAITFTVKKKFESINPAATVGVVCTVVVIFTIVALVVVISNRKENKEYPEKSHRIHDPRSLHVGEEEVYPCTSQPEGCQTPLCAVVDKTNNRTNIHSTQVTEAGDHMEKLEKREFSEPSLPSACLAVYAVVDKTKAKSSGRCDDSQKLNKSCASQGKEENMSEDVNSYDSDLVEYQNSMYSHQTQGEDIHKWDARSSVSHFHTVDGRWVNSANLLYTFPTFDVGDDLCSRSLPTHEETEYCTLRMVEKFSSFNEESDD